MFMEAFHAIDRGRPWLVPLRGIHQALADDIASRHFKVYDPVYDWLNDYCYRHDICITNSEGVPLKFTHQNDLPHGMMYEAFIGKYQQIPTRDNLHDWFGACIWSIFPKTKALLNAKHLANLDDDASGNKRNRLRDTITVFDENGAVLVVSQDEMGSQIAEGLVRFDWQACLVQSREYWAGGHTDSLTGDKAKVFVFGHALLEQLVRPRKPLCSHAVIVPVDTSFFDWDTNTQLEYLDGCLVDYLSDFLTQGVTPRQLHPLPILGVPYFWDNADPAFYQDDYVFRQGRIRQA